MEERLAQTAAELPIHRAQVKHEGHYNPLHVSHNSHFVIVTLLAHFSKTTVNVLSDIYKTNLTVYESQKHV